MKSLQVTTLLFDYMAWLTLKRVFVVINCVKCPCNIFNVKCHYNLCFHNNNDNIYNTLSPQLTDESETNVGLIVQGFRLTLYNWRLGIILTVVFVHICSLLFSLFALSFCCWFTWLALLTCKNRRPYNLYCVGGDVKRCTIQSNRTCFVCFTDQHLNLYWIKGALFVCFSFWLRVLD